MIYRHFSDLLHAYHRLEAGDVYLGRIPASHLKSVIMTDLRARGIILVPDALAHSLHASKVAQALVLQPWMPPQTVAVTRRKQLLETLDAYRQLGIETVVTKEDRLHCGHGIRRWADLELLYNCMGLDDGAFPFVLQPFQPSFVDIRVIWVGDFHEAYRREYAANFRQNLSGGGQSRPHELTHTQQQFCREVVARARMPYAHIDLMLVNENEIYVSEVRLNGGIHGARVTRPALERLKREQLETLATSLQNQQ